MTKRKNEQLDIFKVSNMKYDNNIDKSDSSKKSNEKNISSITSKKQKIFSDESNRYIDVTKICNKTRILKVISLFSGCGGMDLGIEGGFTIFNRIYENNPFEIVFSNDIIEKACTTYNHNFSHKSYCGDIKNLDLESLPKADIVIGGFPCQDFSLAGKRKGLTSDRGRLYLEMKKVVEHVNPLAFIAENVDGIRKNSAGVETSALDVIIDDFRSLNYDVMYLPLNAANYGVPQNRVRIIIIGIRKDLNKEIKYPRPTYGVADNPKLFTSFEAIDDLWNQHDNPNIHNHSDKFISKARFYEGKKMQGNYQIKSDKPSPTIRSEHHGNIEAHYRLKDENKGNSSDNWRRLSVRECARLQSFPDNFEFPLAGSDAYKQIGNAVPPILAWHIARALYLSITSE